MLTNKTLLIGHRGVGKTSLLSRINDYLPDAICICLDREIEKTWGNIGALFKEKGEKYFRGIEIQTFENLKQKYEKSSSQVFIALGAGYEGDLPKDWQILWVKREVDMSQMFFANRPSLDEVNQSLAIPEEKFESRHSRYQYLATQELILLEDPYFTSKAERSFFQDRVLEEGFITLLPEQRQNLYFEDWYKTRKSWGFSFEWRDDLITSKEDFSEPIDLFSFRTQEKIQENIPLALQAKQIDWPLEFGEVPAELKSCDIIYSLHSENKDFRSDLARLLSLDGFIKWAPEVSSFDELVQGYRWQKQNPKLRSFLPISSDGRWKWYRKLMYSHQPVNFLREGGGSAADQPTLLEWIEFNKSFSQFAAILGSPVKHSWTPSFHRKFFQNRKANVLEIDLFESELTIEHLSFLYECGLRWAAVTSPLKNKLAEVINSTEEALNTLCSKDKYWVGANTDVFGLNALLEKVSQTNNVVVWGGGGVLTSIQQVLPQASYYSHQTQAPREGSIEVSSPDILIWALGRKNWDQSPHFPKFKKAPKQVIDLNYSFDSPAIAYANQVGGEYISGEDMFEAQAQQQQKFWQSQEIK